MKNYTQIKNKHCFVGTLTIEANKTGLMTFHFIIQGKLPIIRGDKCLLFFDDWFIIQIKKYLMFFSEYRIIFAVCQKNKQFLELHLKYILFDFSYSVNTVQRLLYYFIPVLLRDKTIANKLMYIVQCTSPMIIKYSHCCF